MNQPQRPRHRHGEQRHRAEPAQTEPEQEHTDEEWVVAQIQESFESRA